jgi:hypothetical protein
VASHRLEGSAWQERSCARTDSAGVANARQKAQGHARQLAGQLQRALASTGRRVLVAVQNRGEDDEDQYWLGYATRVTSHCSHHVLIKLYHHSSQPSHDITSPEYRPGFIGRRVVKVHTETGTVCGTRVRYDKDDLEIEIEPWLQRDVSGGDERRTFRPWEASPGDEAAGFAADPGPVTGRVYTVNSTELRAVGLELEAVAPVGGAPLGVVARVRRTAAVAGETRRLQGVMRAVHAEVAAPRLRELWTISSADENLILGHCW